MKKAHLSFFTLLALMLLSTAAFSQTSGQATAQADTRSMAEVQSSLKKNLKEYGGIFRRTVISTFSKITFDGCKMTLMSTSAPISSGIATHSDAMGQSNLISSYIDIDLKDIDAARLQVSPFAQTSPFSQTVRKITFFTLNGNKSIRTNASGDSVNDMRSDKVSTHFLSLKAQGADAVYNDVLRAVSLCQGIK